MRLATIDVGTNTAKLLVAEAKGTGFQSLYEERRYVRLGEGVDAAGKVKVPALLRLVTALTAFKAAAAHFGAHEILIGATSASRDAQNREELVTFVEKATGLTYRILSGEEEAALSFAGALSAFPDLTGPCAVVDIGGGSTEVVGGTPGQTIFRFRTSINVGSVRLTERCFSAQPPPAAEIEAATGLVRKLVAEAIIPHDPHLTLVGAAGTTGALARMHHHFTSWGEVEGHALWISREDVQAWREKLTPLSFDETLALNPTVMSGRADIFLSGVLILEEIVRCLGVAGLRISPRGLRHGLALQALRDEREALGPFES